MGCGPAEGFIDEVPIRLTGLLSSHGMMLSTAHGIHLREALSKRPSEDTSAAPLRPFTFVGIHKGC